MIKSDKICKIAQDSTCRRVGENRKWRYAMEVTDFYAPSGSNFHV